MCEGLAWMQLGVLLRFRCIKLRVRLVPVDHVTIESACPAQELSQRLSSSVGRPARWWPFWRRDKASFEGSVDGQHFAISPCARFGRYSSIELYIHGKIVARDSGSAIEAVIRPHWFFIGFSVAWVLAMLGMTGFMVAYPSAGNVRAGDYAPFIMFAVVGYVIFLRLFRGASRRAREMLGAIAG